MNKQSFSTNKILAPKQQYQDMRDAFFEELFQIASLDKDVIVLMADQGAMTFKKFEERIPDQLINVGIAEQNMISVAAGLALCGKKVFAHAIANFTTLRCYEQIKVDLSISNLPVTIIGVGAGFTYGSDGPTHHANQDIPSMRAIPGMRILNASDSVSLSNFPHLTYQKPQLTYIRFDKTPVPELYDIQNKFIDGMHEFMKGTNAVIISTGIMTHEALQVAKEIGNTGVIDIYQLQPLPEKLLRKTLAHYKYIIVLEEHLAYGGLATIIADFLADTELQKKFLRIGLPDTHCFFYGDRTYMHEQIGLSKDTILKTIRNFI